MQLGMSARIENLVQLVREMVRGPIMAAEEEFFAEVGRAPDRFQFTERQTVILAELKAEAKSKGLWNFWRHDVEATEITNQDLKTPLTTVEYAYIAEEMGWCAFAPEIFNCSAPDTGNMEVLLKFGSSEHQQRWLKPLLAGNIRSAFLMTEPQVASSDATNLEFSAVKTDTGWLFNGEKYWSTGAGDPRCQVYIVMAKTGSDNEPRHSRHSMFVIDANLKGIEKVRPMTVFGHDHAPFGHMHLKFHNVEVPATALLIGEGRGFEVSQARLGPGRIHHCMRAIGQSERALELLCKRALSRKAFGKVLAKLGANYDIIAEARIAIEQTRLLCLKAAWLMDQAKLNPALKAQAASLISQVKVAAPKTALKIIDEAIQIFGGTGVSQDTPLAEMYTMLRTLRLADGPDAVHRMQVARHELRAYQR